MNDTDVMAAIPSPRGRHRAEGRARTPLTDLGAAVAGRARPLSIVAGGGLLAVTAPTVLVSSEAPAPPDDVVTGQLVALPSVQAVSAEVAAAETREVVYLTQVRRESSAARARQAVADAEAQREAQRVAAEQEAARQAAEAAAKAAEEEARVAAAKKAEAKNAAVKATPAPSSTAQAKSTAKATASSTAAAAVAEEVPAPSGDLAADIIATASKYIGTDYYWGGKSPKTGFDCSGLVSWAYGQNGVKITGSAHDQSKKGVRVSRADARPGDLVFFGSSRVHHVGIYVGNGKILDAPREGKQVSIRSIWADSTIQYRRVL